MCRNKIPFGIYHAAGNRRTWLSVCSYNWVRKILSICNEKKKKNAGWKRIELQRISNSFPISREFICSGFRSIWDREQQIVINRREIRWTWPERCSSRIESIEGAHHTSQLSEKAFCLNKITRCKRIVKARGTYGSKHCRAPNKFEILCIIFVRSHTELLEELESHSETWRTWMAWDFALCVRLWKNIVWASHYTHLNRT